MAEHPSDFDFRRELLRLFHDAGPDVDKRLKVLALMEKVGGFVTRVKEPEPDAEAQHAGRDPIARQVQDRLNGKS